MYWGPGISAVGGRSFNASLGLRYRYQFAAGTKEWENALARINSPFPPILTFCLLISFDSYISKRTALNADFN
jgi:hypothetical protein